MSDDVEVDQKSGKIQIRLFGDTKWTILKTQKGAIRELRKELKKALGRQLKNYKNNFESNLKKIIRK